MPFYPSAIVGILPGTAAIGVAAPLLLVLLRLVQGLVSGSLQRLRLARGWSVAKALAVKLQCL
jgi:hypothetical protein